MGPRKLGRGLESLMPDARGAGGATSGAALQVPIDEIGPSKTQPRKAFEDTKIQELADSIKAHGILQPVIVRVCDDCGPGKRYELIAGERRWRAAKVAGLESVPCVVREHIDPAEVLEIQLVENIQREDLNPIEKAEAYRTLMSSFSLTQEDVAIKVGQNRATIANMLRLLDLPKDIQDTVSRGTLTMGHARALLAIANPMHQRAIASRVVLEGLSVREVERIVATTQKGAIETGQHERLVRPPKPPHIVEIEERVMRVLGCKVDLQVGQDNRGKLVVEFADNNDFERVLEQLGITLEP